MMNTIQSTLTIDIPSHLTDDELVAAIPDLAGDERRVTARLIAHLAELDKRQLFLPAGCSSLYTYCREALGYTEDAAHNRGVVARAARRYPAILDMLADGRLSLTTGKLLVPVLTEANCDAVLKEAAGGSKRDVETIVARLNPRPDVPSRVWRLPAPTPTPTPAPAPAPTAEPAADGVEAVEGASLESHARRSADGGAGGGTVPERPAEPAAGAVPKIAPTKRPEVKPLAPERYRVQFTIGEETEKKLRRLQTLLRREVPDGDPAVLFDRGLDLLLAAVERKKHGKTARRRSAADGQDSAEAAGAGDKRQKPRSRHLPARTRRVVSLRDEEQCAFVGTDGRRCTERAFLEYHHGPRPFGHGGPPTPGNIALHCRAHNAYEGRRIFGDYLPREVREARVLYDAMRFAVPERR